jgi:DNA-binding NtrC family response regulator
MVPPLRERREDIPQLVEHFCRRTRAEITEQTVIRMKEAFALRAWPGNVRELRNAVERAVLLPSLALEPAPVDAGDEWSSVRTDPVARAFRSAKEGAIDSWEKRYLSALMRLVHGNISRAARLVQVDRSHLRDLLRRHQIPGGDNQR